MNNIYHRVSIRKYKDCPVEKDKLLQILKAGMQAPNACNQQPWEFYVVTDKETIQKLSQITPYAGCAAKAPVIIVPVYRTEGLPALPMVAIDMGMALENIWLETDALGLGGVCIGIRPVRFWVLRKTCLFFHCLRSDTRTRNGHSRIALIEAGFIL